MSIVGLGSDAASDLQTREPAGTTEEAAFISAFKPDIGDAELIISKEGFATLYNSQETEQAGGINGVGGFNLRLANDTPGHSDDQFVSVEPDGEGGYLIQGSDEALERAQEIISGKAGGVKSNDKTIDDVKENQSAASSNLQKDSSTFRDLIFGFEQDFGQAVSDTLPMTDR